MVECDLAKVDVAGSNPVSRSIDSFAGRAGGRAPPDEAQHLGPATQAVEGRGTQVVRERSAKPLCAGSNPARASKIQ